jgi:hypothetical protein
MAVISMDVLLRGTLTLGMFKSPLVYLFFDANVCEILKPISSMP